MGLNQFWLGQHTSATSKVLKARANQHQVIAGSIGVPTLADVASLTAPYGFSLPEMVAMLRSVHNRLQVVLDSLLERDQPVTKIMDAVILTLIERETEFEEYSSRDPRLKTKLSALITQWI